jgi:hypothetical protein
MNKGSNGHIIWKKSQPLVSMIGFEDDTLTVNMWVICWLLISHPTAQTDCCNYWLPVFDKIYQDHSVVLTALSLVFCHSPVRTFEQLCVRKIGLHFILFMVYWKMPSVAQTVYHRMAG